MVSVLIYVARSDWSAEARPLKRASVLMAMDVVAKLLSPHAAVEHAIMLPGATWFDTETALDAGIIDRERTRILAVERDERIYPHSVAMSRSLGFRYDPACRYGELSNLEDVARGVGYAFLDFNTVPDADTAMWVSTILAPKMMQGGVILMSMSCCADDRGNRLPGLAREFFHGEAVETLRDLRRRLTYWGTARSLEDEPGVCIATALSMFAHRGCSPTPVVFEPYRDGGRTMLMAAFRFSRKESFKHPRIETIIKDLAPTVFRTSGGRTDGHLPPISPEMRRAIRELDEIEKVRYATMATLSDMNKRGEELFDIIRRETGMILPTRADAAATFYSHHSQEG